MPDTISGHTLTDQEYNALSAQAANYRTILTFLKASGLDEFLVEQKHAPVDLMQTPADLTGGETALVFLKAIADECNAMDQKITLLEEANAKAEKMYHALQLQMEKTPGMLMRFFHLFWV